MKSDEIKNLFSQFEAAASDLERVECWSARELQNLSGYGKWENFGKVIQKAKDACRQALVNYRRWAGFKVIALIKFCCILIRNRFGSGADLRYIQEAP